MSEGLTRPKWALHRSAVYLLGKGIHYGGAGGRILQRRAYDKDVYCINVDYRRSGDADVITDNLSIFKPNSFNWAFIELDGEDDERQTKELSEIVSLVKQKGHVIILSKNVRPEVIRLSSNVLWTEKDYLLRDDWAFAVYKKGNKSKHRRIVPSRKKPKGKTACVVRYGAHGDLLIITPLLKRLKEDGYHVTVNAQASSAPLLFNNSNVDNLLIQERDAIPQAELSEYWAEWESHYDKYINLSESIEGSELKVEYRRNYYVPKKDRESSINYYDKTLELGGYTDVKEPLPELHFTKSEVKDVDKILNFTKDRFMVGWSLKGSSHHKMYSIARPLIDEWTENKEDIMVYLLGGPDAEGLSFNKHNKVISLVNKLPFRKVGLLTHNMNVVVGPETGVMHCAAAGKVPTILLLSHSNKENIAKYWKDCLALEPNVDCYPCHQMHYSLTSCPQGQILDDDNSDKVLFEGPLCTISSRVGGAIPAVKIIERLDSLYNDWKESKQSD